MLLWLKYCFDFQNFKKYKETLKNNNFQSKNKEILTIDVLTHSIRDLQTTIDKNSNSSYEQIKNIIDGMKEVNNNKFSELKESTMREFKNLLTSNQTAVNGIKEINEAKFSDLKNSTIQKISELQNSNQTAVNGIKEINEAKFSDLKESTMREFKNLLNSNQTAVNGIKEINEAKFSDLKNSTIQKITELQNSNQNAIKEIKDANSEIKRLSSTLIENNKIRGTFGEVVLENLLINVFGTETSRIWQRQYTFKNNKNTTVDFVIKYPIMNKYIPIDSKFLGLNNETIETIVSNGEVKKEDIKKIIDTTKKQIKDINEKYVKNIIETTEFGIMFIPAEGIYNILLNQPSIFEYAYKNSIFICSPNNIMAILMTLIEITKNININHNLQEIISKISNIKTEYTRLNKRWDDFQKIVKNSLKNMDDISITFKKIEKQSEKIIDLNSFNNNNSDINLLNNVDSNKKTKELI